MHEPQRCAVWPCTAVYPACGEALLFSGSLMKLNFGEFCRGPKGYPQPKSILFENRVFITLPVARGDPISLCRSAAATTL